MSVGAINWPRVSRGLYLAGFGCFLLLTTLGFMSWSRWREALAFWPVLLVALGIKLIFERSRASWAVVISPLLVLGTLAAVALKGPSDGPRDWAPLRAERPREAERWTFEGRLALANLDVTARPLPADVLVEGRATPPGHATLEVIERPTAVRVRLGGRGRERLMVILPGRQQACELALSRDLPLALDLGLAFAEGGLDLAAAEVSRADLHGAFNHLTIRLGPPKSDVRLRFAGAFNQLRLVVPPSTPVLVTKGGFLNSVDGRPGARSLQGPGYRLHLAGAFNHLAIGSDQEPVPAAPRR